MTSRTQLKADLRQANADVYRLRERLRRREAVRDALVEDMLNIAPVQPEAFTRLTRALQYAGRGDLSGDNLTQSDSREVRRILKDLEDNDPFDFANQ